MYEVHFIRIPMRVRAKKLRAIGWFQYQNHCISSQIKAAVILLVFTFIRKQNVILIQRCVMAPILNETNS